MNRAAYPREQAAAVLQRETRIGPGDGLLTNPSGVLRVVSGSQIFLFSGA